MREPNINPAKYRKPDTRDHCYCGSDRQHDDRRTGMREREEFVVKQCRHGHIWVRVAAYWNKGHGRTYWGLEWKRLTPLRNPIRYRRAIEAIEGDPR